MMGTKTIYNKMFIKIFMYTGYKTINVRKILQMSTIVSQ